MKKLNFWKTCIGGGCLAGTVFIVFIIVNGMVKGEVQQSTPVNEVIVTDSIFHPTVDDVMVLDTMLNQVQDIEKDIDTLNVRIDRIEDKIDELIIEQAK